MPESERVVVEPEVTCDYVPKSLLELVLFKSDRTIAVIGIVVIGCWSLGLQMEQIAIAAVGGLVGYIGGRSGN